ncbi:MAG: transketolase [Dysgonamonadaceae bacterium]|jgi:transketolase|nr:transketolase [Dysgonamonadaceae bacterium]
MIDSNIEEKAAYLRKKFIQTAWLVDASHVASSLSCIDIITALYFGNILRYNIANPQLPDRDRFILSKGHAALALYNALCEAGFFSRDELYTYCKPGSIFGGHPTPKIPGIECATGALGHGLSFAVGTALSLRQNKSDSLIYVITGDGECQEGAIWEAAMSITHFNLSNLIWIIDNNKWQITGETKKVMGLEPLEKKLLSFGFDVFTVNGHNQQEIINVLRINRTRLPKKPLAIIANTIKGKGTSILENKADAHDKKPTKSEYETILQEFGISKEEV